MSDPHDPTAKPPTPEPDEDFASLFAASEKEVRPQRVAVGDVVSGTVIAIGQSAAFIAIGGKGEATIDLAELRDPTSGELKLVVGDPIQATVADDGSRSGTVVLKRVLGHASAELEQALANRIPVEGVVTAEVKGGFEIQLGSTRAFCPGSHIDVRRGGERVLSTQYIGQRFPFRVIKVENKGRNVVVSRRELLEEEAAAEAAKTWERVAPGVVLTGRVTSLRDFGAFIDLGGVEGMVHVSELGYGRVGHPRDVLTAGQQVEVQVLRIEESSDRPGRRQIALSLKALAADPWSTVTEKIPVGSTVTGTVRRVEPFGAFVEVAPGIEGLVHISKITMDRRLSHARQVLTVGQSVEVTVTAVDPAQRRLSLSMVEHAKRARDDEEASERREQDAMVGETNQQKSFGSFAQLLQQPKKDK